MESNLASQLTVIIPAYNEEQTVGETVRSVLSQTMRPARVIVVDDGSTDITGEMANIAGAEVIHPGKNTGSKAGAQNFALEIVNTKYTMTIDADTTFGDHRDTRNRYNHFQYVYCRSDYYFFDNINLGSWSNQYLDIYQQITRQKPHLMQL